MSGEFKKRYIVERKIGKGTYGVVYSGKEIASGDGVAIKLERANFEHKVLAGEIKVYQSLKGIGMRFSFATI